jgi:CheY-like chemotaxis protein/phosphoribosyl 1,2-cyclic phosphodiesterase
MKIRFWGTRGSIAKPGPLTVRYGGNTSCVEVRADDGTLIVLDCGTGAHDLGKTLTASARGPVRGHLLISHTHWDHIQGFPFFAPLFTAGNEWDVYAPQGVGQRLEQALAGQMEYTYFPITLEAMDATLRYHDLVESAFEVGGVRVTTRYLNHPGVTLGYRLEVDGVTLVYATDHEPHSRHPLVPRRDRGTPVHREDQRHIEFLAGADLVIHDAQYTLVEYDSKVSWGHTPAELAVEFARAAGVRTLALFHHDPGRTDDDQDDLLAACRERAAAGRHGPEVFAASEGQELALAPAASRPSVASRARPRPRAAPRVPGPPTILIVDDDPEMVSLLVETLEPEGFRLLSAGDGDAALRIARAQRPHLVLLDWRLPRRDGLEVCRALRSDGDPHLRAVPVVLLTGNTAPGDTAAGFDAGVTDYITKPFKPTHVRARVHTWLQRTLTEPLPGQDG